MSASLPIAMLQMMSSNTDNRASRYLSPVNPWPFPHLIQKWYWEKPEGYFEGGHQAMTASWVKCIETVSQLGCL
jgi:hypothetical protein